MFSASGSTVGGIFMDSGNVLNDVNTIQRNGNTVTAMPAINKICISKRFLDAVFDIVFPPSLNRS